MSLSSHFSQTYAEAREKFIDAANRHALAIDERHHPDERGADGETLSMDVVLIGAEDAKDLLVLSSGVHGVEGFCGSGCQVALLSDSELMRRVRAGSNAVLLIHAVNPYGFSYWKRVNEDNVDLNRNFHDFLRPLPDNPGYTALHPLLVPPRWPPGAINFARIGLRILRQGMPAIQSALSHGQHQLPEGLFFGGLRPTWSNETLRAVLRQYGEPRRNILWLDLHTGLGKRGACEKIHIDRDDTEKLEVAREIWGREVTSMYDGSSLSARLEGLVFEAIYDECPSSYYTGVALEYGTIASLRVVYTLRADAWLLGNPDAPARLRSRIRRSCRDAFYIDRDDWKRAVWTVARRSVVQALDWLDSRPA